MQKLAGTLQEAAARQYIIEIYKFSSTPALLEGWDAVVAAAAVLLL